MFIAITTTTCPAIVHKIQSKRRAGSGEVALEPPNRIRHHLRWHLMLHTRVYVAHHCQLLTSPERWRSLRTTTQLRQH